MKILFLTTFIICLICVLTLKVESFENNEVSGGFIKTCKNLKLSGSNLYSECKNAKGKSISATINLDGCITNKDGKLATGGSGFVKSSKKCALKGNTLKCQSKNKKGKFIKSSINIDKFVTNSNGLLKCGKITSKVGKAAKGKAPKGKALKGKAPKGKGLSGFAKTCTGLKFDAKKNTISAVCKNAKGKKVKASASLTKCVGNNNGKLVKGGKFNKSSKTCKMNGKGLLTCKSKNKKGKYGKATLDLNTILGNINGKIQC